MALEVYRRKRDFRTTPEPEGRVAKRAAGPLAFVVQKHRASHLHYDFRLELDGVLLSWAVPKGPSLDPADKRLAMHVEDHPVEYGDFEGVIPPDQYGSGTVLVWDRGTWTPREDPHEGYRRGRLKFTLDGEKLRGGWTLVRARGSKYGDRDTSWLLIKEKDGFARTGDGERIVDERPESVLSGRDLEAIAADPDRVWSSGKSVDENVRGGKVERETPRLDVARIAGARKAKLPATLGPQLATLVDAAPEGDGWLHEIKYDGYRMLLRLEKGACRIVSRNGLDWTARFPALAREAARIPVAGAWIDGELVAMDAKGRSSFQALQNALAGGGRVPLVYFAFDLPHVDGHDLRGCALAERKRVLRALLPRGGGPIRFSDHVEGGGAAFHREACRLGLEGIVSKRAASTYRAARSRDWQKVKCTARQEFVIGGWTDPQGSRSGFGALLLGVHDGGRLRYVGKVGTGFDDATIATLHARLAPLARPLPPFDNPPTGAEARRAHWVEPSLVAEVAFTEWTDGGTLRHPSFQGLRDDKPARDVVREGAKDLKDGNGAGAAGETAEGRPIGGRRERAPARAAAPSKSARSRKPAGRAATSADGDPNFVAGIAITHPERILYPESGHTKLDVARYYERVGDWLLPHLAHRPLTLVRCPTGWGARGRKCFYQKHRRAGIPDVVEPIEVPENGGVGVYMMANTVSAVVALVQMGVLEFHPWGSREGALDRPDRIVLDFDPDEALPWPSLVEAVGVGRALLDNLGLQGFLRTTGGKGLHIVVPIEPEWPWAAIKGFTKAIAELLVRTFPDRFVAKATLRERTGRVFVDYLRNAEGATAIAPYSLRAKAGAPVAMPIAPSELGSDVRFRHFDLESAPPRLARRRRDPWSGFFDVRQPVTTAMMARVGFRPD